MDERVDTPAALATSQRLLALAEAQTAALVAADVETFVRVTSERDALPLRLDAPLPPALQPALRATLERVVALDRANLARARALLRATERGLRQVRQGQVALRGYGRPGDYLTAEPALLDQQE